MSHCTKETLKGALNVINVDKKVYRLLFLSSAIFIGAILVAYIVNGDIDKAQEFFFSAIVMIAGWVFTTDSKKQ
jgi:uncharacterized membrane protein YjjP (DUF1212 family)